MRLKPIGTLGLILFAIISGVHLMTSFRGKMDIGHEIGGNVRISQNLPRRITSVDIKLDRDRSVAAYFDAQSSAERDQAIKMLDESLGSLSEDELSVLIGQHGKSDDSTEIVYTRRMLEVLSKKNPRLALNLFSQTKGLPGGAGVGFMESVANFDEEALISWSSSVDLAKSRVVVRPLMVALAKKNPDAAGRLIAGQSDSNLASIMVNQLFAALPGGSRKAVEMAKDLPPEIGNQALIAIAHRYADKHPKEALNAIELTAEDHDGRRASAYQKVFQNLLRMDSDYAIEALSMLESSGLQAILANKISLKQVIEVNPAAAMQLLDGMVKTASNATTFKDASFLLAQSDPETAFLWSLSFLKVTSGKRC